MTRLSEPLDIPRDCLKTLDLSGRLTSMDADGLCVMEIDDFSTVHGLPWAPLWPETERETVANSVATAAGGKVARFSALCPTAKGTLKAWEVSVVPIRDETGRVVALQSLSQDVTQRDFERREALLVSRELIHRIKNLFATVDGIVHLSARGTPDASDFVRGLRARLSGLGRAIAFIHPIDQEAQSAPRTIRGLIQAILTPYETDAGTTRITGRDQEIGVEVVTSLALVLNELATNAVKHGALNRSGGRLAIELDRRDETMVLTWRETWDDPIGAEPGAAGFGTTLLDRTVRLQLLGRIERHWSPNGVTTILTIPADRLTRA